MTTLYENERQVQSVIARYQREAGDANRLRAAGAPSGHGVGTLAMSIVHPVRLLTSKVRTTFRHGPTVAQKSAPPAIFLHSPK